MCKFMLLVWVAFRLTAFAFLPLVGPRSGTGPGISTVAAGEVSKHAMSTLELQWRQMGDAEEHIAIVRGEVELCLSKGFHQ